VAAAVSEVIGLFVGSWVHAGAICLVILLAVMAARVSPTPIVGFGLAFALAATAVAAALIEGRPRPPYL
jgi:hypothetical protein